jgi:hypothetical protein
LTVSKHDLLGPQERPSVQQRRASRRRHEVAVTLMPSSRDEASGAGAGAGPRIAATSSARCAGTRVEVGAAARTGVPSPTADVPPSTTEATIAACGVPIHGRGCDQQ